MASKLTDSHLDDLLFGYIHRHFVPLLETQTTDEALQFLRGQPLGERIVYFYVVDHEGRLVGVIPTRRLLMADPAARLSTIMVRDVVTLPAHGTIREASEAFLKHKLLAIPVVDAGRTLHGIADVGLFAGQLSHKAARDTAHDIFQTIGVHLSRRGNAWTGFRSRFPSLLQSNILGGLIGAVIVGAYASLLQTVVVLTIFMPVVLALSESVSMQAFTLTLQSFHRSDVDWPLLRKSLVREMKTSFLLGAASGAVIGVAAALWQHHALAALSIGVTVASAMTVAAVMGAALPGVLHIMKRDPAFASGPVVLALADLATLVVYFNVGTILLR